MLTYEEALGRIQQAVPAPRRQRVGLEEAFGLVLAESIKAPCNLPRFDNSAVDGYAMFAVSHEERVSNGEPLSALPVVGTAEAGRPFDGVVEPGRAVRIFTGAAVPAGANAVVMQEYVTTRNEEIILDRWPRIGQNIRRRGEDVRRGRMILDAGARVRPEEIGLLAALGIQRVQVFRRPRVSILATGNELHAAGTRLKPGQLYDSNGAMLAALVRQAGATPQPLGAVPDDLELLAQEIRRGLTADVLVCSGGISVGDKDLGRQALQRCGVTRLFWQVNIKPGMPVWFGQRGRTLVFGLPGNPVSAFVTFEEFVAPALARLMGQGWRDPYTLPARLAADLPVSGSRRTQFVRVAVKGDNGTTQVTPLPDQGSHQLRSLAAADGWIRVTANGRHALRSGSPVFVKSGASR